jgi:hypothetical protein
MLFVKKVRCEGRVESLGLGLEFRAKGPRVDFLVLGGGTLGLIAHPRFLLPFLANPTNKGGQCRRTPAQNFPLVQPAATVGTHHTSTTPPSPPCSRHPRATATTSATRSPRSPDF